MPKRMSARGQGLVEYALILVMVVVVVLVVLWIFGPQIGVMYSNVVSSIQSLRKARDKPRSIERGFCDYCPCFTCKKL